MTIFSLAAQGPHCATPTPSASHGMETAPSREKGAFFPEGRRFAAPSWVIPGTLAENCAFLAGRVDEAALLFFDAKASLEYTEKDIPSRLALLPLSYHVHLPAVLPWHAPSRAAAICAALLGKINHLKDSTPGGKNLPSHCRGVLHPPPHDPADAGKASRSLAAFSRSFREAGGDPSLLFLENVGANNLTDLTGVISGEGFGVCLDTGHMLAYGQEHLSGNAFLLERTGLLHLNAPGRSVPAGAHLPLTALDATGRRCCETVVRAAPPEAVLVAELFKWEDIERSLPLIRSWLLPRA